MPNTREKLIELLDVAATIANNICSGIACEDCDGYSKGCTLYHMVDTLIANGVAVQKWIPVTERLPDDDSDVLAYLSDEYESQIFPANYAKGVWFDCISDVCQSSVTHWMPLPQPPKGE